MQNTNEPIWINKPQEASGEHPIIFVATPVHSDCSIHFAQSLLLLQQECFKKQIKVSFCLLKSSLVTQGRNLCVSNMFNESVKYTHFLFVDSDIEFNPESIFRMIKEDRDVISVPYPMKTIDWNKIVKRQQRHGITDAHQLSEAGYTWPVKIENKDEVVVKNNVAEVSHVPTGCTMYKRSVFEKMMEKYPDLRIHQPTMINGKQTERKYFYNFFDTFHDPENKRYYGEDFGFCKRWTNIGGKCHILVDQSITHIGEYSYHGKIFDDLNRAKVVDEPYKS